MKKAIIFDIGGVYFTDGTKKAVEIISRKYKIDKDEVKKFLGTEAGLGKAYRSGKITGNEFWKKFQENFGMGSRINAPVNFWINSYKPIRGTIKIIKDLRKNGFRVYFLSDNVKERVIFLERKYKFKEDFDGGIFSNDAGVTKADGGKIFNMAVRMAHHKPENIVYIDDKEKYVEIAQSIGMHGILFTNPKQLSKELNSFLK